MAPDVGTLVIGAGAVGLASAYGLARAGREVLVLEAEAAIGQGVSSRNSEVIHAGIYYPAGSLKARFCAEGRRALYAFCEEFGVPHGRSEKIIVAANETQLGKLSELQAKARANDVDDLQELDRADPRALDPALSGVGGLLSPTTGVLDSHAYMLALQGAIEARGGAVALQSAVESASVGAGQLTLRTGGPTPMSLTARRVVIAGGLFSSAIARRFEGLAPASPPPTYFALGNYFSLARRAPFCRLVYPVPEPGGLGVHVKLDLAGQAPFGPDGEWLDETEQAALSYHVDPARSQKFYAAIRQYWPDLLDDELAPAYAGVRPKLTPRGGPDADFLIHDAANHGAEGVVALYGVESSDLTSSLAIGAEVARRLGGGAT